MIIRHRFTIRDGLGVAAVAAATAVAAWQINVFPGESDSVRKLMMELDEAFAVLSLCLALVSWSRFAAQKREIKRRIAAEKAVRILAFEDPLTGLANRRQFDAALSAAVAAPPRSGGSHAVLVLDLNGFKKINDVYGHPVGDGVLVEVAGRLRQAVREGDLVARLGGDEFAVLSTHLAGPEAATGIARRIIDLLEPPVASGPNTHQVATAIGIALAPQDGDAEEILRKADIALYRAKNEGRSAVRFFEDEMDAQVRERDSLERALRAALAAGEVKAQYQPQIDLKTGRVVGFEALARWTHPTMGPLPPERFIPIADDCGLIGELTDQIMRQACTEAARWPKGVTLSVNVSPVQLKDALLGLRIMAILAETGLAPNRLEIEITESALVRDMDAAKELLGALRAAGVKIALDDFGTGYSSLYHLRSFKLDKIKIDRSFIAAMLDQPESAAIVRALLGLGHGLGLVVTAEGVESADQQAALADQGCDQAQGFLYSAAVPAGETLALVTGPRRARRA